MEKIIIVGPASQLLAMKTAKKMGIKAIDCDFKKFPDGETYVRINVKDDTELENKEIIIIQSTYANTTGEQSKQFFDLFNMIGAARRMKAAKIVVVVPYFAYGRQDKVFRPGECVFAQELCKLIEMTGANEFITVDIHNPQIFDVFTIPVKNLDPMKYIAEYMKDNLDIEDPIVVSPDKGAKQRSTDFAQHFGENVQVEVFDKKRDVITGEIQMNGSLNVKNKDVIIADDIIATGGTMANAIEISKKSGARNVYAIGTHPLLIKNAVMKILNAGCDVIVGTDTIDNPVPLVSMADLLAENL